MHQNAGLRAAYNRRGLSALISFFVIVVTCGQKVTNIDRFSHGWNLLFFSVYLFCFVLFRRFLLLFFASFNLSLSYACALITIIEPSDSNEDHCFYNDLTIILLCTFFSSRGIVHVFNRRRSFIIARCWNC